MLFLGSGESNGTSFKLLGPLYHLLGLLNLLTSPGPADSIWAKKCPFQKNPATVNMAIGFVGVAVFLFVNIIPLIRLITPLNRLIRDHRLD